jgi:AraC-like DNA-binding protein
MSKEIPKAYFGVDTAPADILPFLWRKSIEPFFDATPVEKTQDPRTLPRLQQYHLGKSLFMESQFPGQRFVRDRAWMQQHDDVDHLSLQLFARGENRVVNGGHDFVEKAGNIYAVNLAYEVKAESTDSEVFLLVLPRSLIMDAVPHLATVRGPLFAPGSFSARIFVDYMQSLRTNLAVATRDEVSTIIESTLGLLDSLTRHHDVGSSQAEGHAIGTACRHIERNLKDPALSVDSICAHLQCSRATLYRLFKRHGGVQDYIQRRRLMACFKAIRAAKNAHRLIYDIAMDFGFTSPSHFSHLFRGQFGMTPREARAAAVDQKTFTVPVEGLGLDDGERMWLWAKTLAAV